MNQGGRYFDGGVYSSLYHYLLSCTQFRSLNCMFNGIYQSYADLHHTVPQNAHHYKWSNDNHVGRHDKHYPYTLF